MARPSKAFLAAQRKVKRDARLAARLTAIGASPAEQVMGFSANPHRKFRNVHTVYNGQRYDSVGEAEYAAKLDLRCKAGEIVDWERPKALVLVDSPKAAGRITMKPDFWILPAGDGTNGYYLDYKGGHITETPVFRLKVKLWKQAIPHELRVAYSTGEERIVASGNECFAYRDALARANVPAAD